jgi:protein-tyrosine-phosphatase
MAEGMLRSLLARAGVKADIGSAGLLPGGVRPTPEAIAAMSDRHIDISDHVSRKLDPEQVRSTPLVIGMARVHVREAVVTHGADVEHTFTLKELVRRGDEAGPRQRDETVFAWLARVGAGRRTADLMGDDPDDDIVDPVGRPREVYEDVANELEILLRQLVALLVGGPPRSAAYARRPANGVIRGVTADEAGAPTRG